MIKHSKYISFIGLPDNKHLTNIFIMSREILEAKMAAQGKSGTMFSNEEYQQYIERLKAISPPGYKMKHDDYYLVKRFKILRVEINGKIYDRLIKPRNQQLKYITFEGTIYIRTL